MVTTSREAVRLYRGWPPDDTEESVVGTNRHQMTIMNTRLGINEVAYALAGPGEPPSFQALSQTMILGFWRTDGTRYTTLPDVFVYRTPIDPDQGSVAVRMAGPPVLVIEVASESTFDSDLDLEHGKGWTYAQGGVREFMVLDPTGAYMPELIRAWRLVGGVYRPWHAEADRRWHSAELPIAITVEDESVAVYSSEGQRQLREGEITATLRRGREELAATRGELAATRDDLDATRGELDATRGELDATRGDLARKDAELAELRRRLKDRERR